MIDLLSHDKLEKIKFVSATRMTEHEFWKSAPLGQIFGEFFGQLYLINNDGTLAYTPGV